MKKAHNSNITGRLTLNKLKIAKLENLYAIKGGEVSPDGGGNDSDTWTEIPKIFG